MKRKNYLMVLISLICMGFFNQKTLAQAGSNDATFNVTDNGRILGSANTIITQPDGKILVGGSFKDGIVRFNSDGSLDNTFNIGTGFNEDVRSMILQSDGKILVGGSFTSYNGATSNYIVRLNPNGSIDNTFSIGTGFDFRVYYLTLQSDGKILVGGDFSNYNGTGIGRIARLNTNGTLDNTFTTTGTGFNGLVSAISIQPDGKLTLIGSFTNYNGTNQRYIARLNTNGTLDTGFNTGTGFNSNSQTLALQSDGKILVGGDFTNYNGTAINRMARLNTDGTLDNTFNNGGSGFSQTVYHIAIQSSTNHIWVGGSNTYNGTTIGGLVRLNGSTGAIDNPVNMGIGATSRVRTFTFQSDGKILVGGIFESYNGVNYQYGLVRLNTNGNLDNTFKNNTGLFTNGGEIFLKMQSDDKIILFGQINGYGYNGSDMKAIIRLNPDGALDNTFSMTGTGFDYDVQSLIFQSDGKIVVGGNFTNYNGTTINRIARLNTNGSLDNSFNVGTGFNNEVARVILQPDGKILIGGRFTSYNGTARRYIARLNADGTLDNTFTTTGTGFDNNVSSIFLQSDGKILVDGDFTSYNGTARRYIARLNADGTLDNTFTTTGTGFDNTFSSMLVQSDGKILLGGYFTSYNGTSTNHIIRLNPDGTLDNTFSIGTGFDNDVNSIFLQSDGKILVGGIFINYNGTPRNKIVQLNANGSIDANFNVGTGFSDYVTNIGIQKNNKIIVVGNFSRYNGIARNGIARIMPSCPSSVSLSDLPVAPLLQPYNQTITQNGLNGNITWSVNGTLPAGLSLNISTGVISGTPTTPVTSVFTIQASNGACNVSKEYNFVVDPIAGIDSKNQVVEKVYPNPSQDKIQIDFKQSGVHSFKMFNSLGKVVREGKIESSSMTLDITSLPQGLYFLEISGQKQAIKIIKQ